MDYLSLGMLAILALVLITYTIIHWKESSAAERRIFVAELVEAAENIYGSEMGQEKLAYVLQYLKQRYPWFPVELMRPLVEAAVARMKKHENTL